MYSRSEASRIEFWSVPRVKGRLLATPTGLRLAIRPYDGGLTPGLQRPESIDESRLLCRLRDDGLVRYRCTPSREQGDQYR